MTQTTTAPTELENTKYLDLINGAAVAVLNTTCGITPDVVEDDSSQQGETLILGIISLVGDVEWSLYLGLPKATAVSVAAKFAGFEIPFESSDIGDAIGELTNIFAGHVKQRLADAGVKANISLPNVLRADSLEVLIQRQASSRRVCFNSPLGKFWTGVLVGASPGLPA
jgi:chemotaxis protein CheX